MSAPAQPAQLSTTARGPARVVGLLALVAGVLAILLIVLGVVGLARAATPNMQGFNPGAMVTVSNSGASVYARSDSDRMNTVCLLDEGGDATTLERPTSEFGVDVAGSDFFEVARVPPSVAAGTYALTCEGTEQALYVGPSAPSTSASGLLGPAGLIGGIVVAFFALALGLIAVFMRRARSKGTSEGKQDAYASGAAQSGYTSPYASPSPGQPQPYGPSYGAQQQPYPDHTPPVQQHPYAPPPPPSWQSPTAEPTQAIAYGQGHFDQDPSEQRRHDAKRGDTQQPSDEPSSDDHPEQDTPPYYPPPPQ